MNRPRAVTAGTWRQAARYIPPGYSSTCLRPESGRQAGMPRNRSRMRYGASCRLPRVKTAEGWPATAGGRVYILDYLV